MNSLNQKKAQPPIEMNQVRGYALTVCCWARLGRIIPKTLQNATLSAKRCKMQSSKSLTIAKCNADRATVTWKLHCSQSRVINQQYPGFRSGTDIVCEIRLGAVRNPKSYCDGLAPESINRIGDKTAAKYCGSGSPLLKTSPKSIYKLGNIPIAMAIWISLWSGSND